MRKSKRMIALVLVLVMVLSSITFSSGSSQAEGDSNSGNKIVLNFPESEKNNVTPGCSYKVSIKKGDKEVAAPDATATSTDANKSDRKIILTDINLANGTYVAEVTSDNWSGYKFKAELKIDGKEQNVTLDKYLTKVTIKFDKNYEGITIKTSDNKEYVKSATGNEVSFDNCDIKVGTNLIVSAKFNGLSFTGNATVGSSDNAIMSAQEYKIDISKVNANIEVSYSTDGTKWLGNVSGNIFKKTDKCYLKFAVNNDTEIINSIKGVTISETGKKVVNGKFEAVSDSITGESINADGIVNVSATVRAVGLQDISSVEINVPQSIAPEIPFNVSYNITMNYGLKVPDSLKNVAPEFTGTPNNVGIIPIEENEKIIGYKVDASNISSSNKADIKKTVTFNLGDEAHTYTKELPIKIGDVLYNRDFEISADEVYPQDEYNYFYRQDNGVAKITVKSGQYSYYRYKVGDEAFNKDFVKFTGTVAFSLTGDGNYSFQMKTENDKNQFGVSKAISVVKDAVAPTLNEISNTAESYKIKDIYVLQDKDSADIILTATDELGGSDVAKIVWKNSADGANVQESFVQSKSVNVISQAVNSTKKGVQTLEFYAIDNVGNVSKTLTYKVQLDNSKPTIECDKFNNNELKKYYNFSALENSSNTHGVNFKLEDNVSIKSYKVTASLNGVEVFKNHEDNTDIKEKTVEVPVKESDGVYSIEITVTDRSGNEENKEYTLVVDSTAPVIDEDNEDYLYAEPVAMDTKVLNSDDESEIGLYEGFDKKYTVYNSSSEIKWKYTETNPSSAIAGFGDHQTIELGDSTSGTAKIKFGEKDYYTIKCDNVPVTVTDKAENKSEFTLKRDKENTTDAGNIVYTNIPVNFGTPKFEVVSKESTTIKRSGDKISATVQVNANINYLIKDFVKATLSKDGTDDVIVTAPTIKLDGNAEDTSTIINLTFDTKNLNDNKYKLLDGIYKLNVYYYDIASGEIKKSTSDDYIYDTTAPEIKSEVDDKNGTITYTVTETNPDFSKFTTTLVSYNNDNNKTKDNDNALAATEIKLNGNPAKFGDLSGLLNQAENWKKTENSNEYTAKIEFEVEGVYSTVVTAVDTAGNNATENASMTYDNTAPQIRDITVIENKKTGRKTENLDYSYFDKQQIVVKVVAEELVGTSYVTCKKDDKENGKSSEIQPINRGIYKNKIDKSTFTYYFAIDADFKGKISFSTKDSNDNRSTKDVNFNKGIIVESNGKHASTASSKLETLNPRDAENGIYNETVRIRLSAQDTYSGLQKVAYTVTNGNTVLESSEVNFNEKGSKIRTSDWTNILELTANESNHKFEGDKITVTFTGKDNADRDLKSWSENYNIDVTKPVIEAISYGSIPANSEFNQRRTVTIRIREHNFDTTRTNVTINKNGSTVKVPVTFTKNGDVWTGTYTFVGGTGDALSDGDYSNIRVESTDRAGNKQVQTKADRFTIDGTKPTMTITYDNNNAKSGSYYGEARTATITVNEHNFAPENITVDARKDGTPISISGWSGSGDTHVATVSFNADGNYTISASCKDRANNQGNSIETQSFTVDLTKPEIAIEGVTNGTSYTGSVLPVVRVTDTNYDEGGVIVTLTGGKNGVRESGYSKSSIANGQAFSFYDLEHAQKMDDCYTLTVKAVDKAGHETTQTISYRVNRFGSIYSLSKALESAVDSYYAAASDKFAIYEQNVDEVKTSTVSYTIDNEIVNLEEGKDYTVKHSEDRTGWNQYEYVLSKDSFAKEGVYTVSVSSEDTVGNISDNKSKGVNMEFCIDNTAPVCIISGVEEGQKIERDASANIGIEAYDNIMFATMKVELNGEQIKSEADLQDGKLSFTVSPTSGEQTLKVTCYDAAGNEKIEEIHFTFDVSILNSHLWIILVIIAICIVLLGMVIIIVNKKRRANQ